MVISYDKFKDIVKTLDKITKHMEAISVGYEYKNEDKIKSCELKFKPIRATPKILIESITKNAEFTEKNGTTLRCYFTIERTDKKKFMSYLKSRGLWR